MDKLLATHEDDRIDSVATLQVAIDVTREGLVTAPSNRLTGGASTRGLTKG
ncbi:MAG: hypothetical protein HC809_02475 [Gammaproteobacteria bacterium]|nr:hypothetical protein [Gammaproteobacteria bacterium]